MTDLEKSIHDGLDNVYDKIMGDVNDKINPVIKKQGALGSMSFGSDQTPTQAVKSELMQMVQKNHDKFLSSTPFELKAVGNMTLGAIGNYGGLTGTSVVSYTENPLMRSYINPHLYDIFRIIPTATGNVSFPRGNNPVGEGSFGAQTEGSSKAQVDYDVTMVNISVPFIAGYCKVSRQMLQDLPFLQAYLSSSLIEDWNRAVDNRFMATITASSTTGVTGATPVSERVIDYIGQHLALGLGQPDLILTTHAVWTSILKTLPTNGGYSVPGGVSIDQAGNIRIAGVPLVPHSAIPTGKIYVMNRNAFATAQASGLSIRSVDTDQDDFIKNLVTYRCEARIELLSFQPTAAIYGSAS